MAKAPGDLLPPVPPHEATNRRIPAPDPLLGEQRAAHSIPPQPVPPFAAPRLLQLLGFTTQFLQLIVCVRGITHGLIAEQQHGVHRNLVLEVLTPRSRDEHLALLVSEEPLLVIMLSLPPPVVVIKVPFILDEHGLFALHSMVIPPIPNALVVHPVVTLFRQELPK